MKAFRSSLRNLALVSILSLQGLSMAAGAADTDAQEQVRRRIVGTEPVAGPAFVSTSHQPSGAGQDSHAFAREHIAPGAQVAAGPTGLASPLLPTFNDPERGRHGVRH